MISIYEIETIKFANPLTNECLHPNMNKSKKNSNSFFDLDLISYLCQ